MWQATIDKVLIQMPRMIEVKHVILPPMESRARASSGEAQKLIFHVLVEFADSVSL